MILFKIQIYIDTLTIERSDKKNVCNINYLHLFGNFKFENNFFEKDKNNHFIYSFVSSMCIVCRITP